MDIQQLQAGLQQGLQQPQQPTQQQFFTPPQPGQVQQPMQQQPQMIQQPGQPQLFQQPAFFMQQPGFSLQGVIFLIPLYFRMQAGTMKSFIGVTLPTGSVQEAYAAIEAAMNAGWPVSIYPNKQQFGGGQFGGQQYNNFGGGRRNFGRNY